MENNDKKIDELIGVVKELAIKVGGNTSAIESLSVQTKDNALAIEDLAVMVKNGFDHVGEEINDLKKDVNDIKSVLDNRIRRYEFDALGRRVDDIELKLKTAN